MSERQPSSCPQDEKRPHNPFSAATWAVILIWSGLVFLLHNASLLDCLAPLRAWDLVFIGSGAILLARVIITLAAPAHRRPVAGSIILALVLIVLGMKSLFPGPSIGAVMLIAIGASILLHSLLR